MAPIKNKVSTLISHPLCETMMRLFDHLPDTYFFIKDDESRFLHANRALLERLGISGDAAFTGTSDSDRYPSSIADQLVADDRRVMNEGQPLIDHPEVLFAHPGKLEWYSTTKFPIVDLEGNAIGVVGFTRSLANQQSHRRPTQAAGRAIEEISRNPSATHRVSELARRFGISERQLHRQFLELTRLTPREFILKSRVHSAAADLRQSDEPIASIAEKYGFCDQSAFTRQFRKVLGTTPARFRANAPTL